MDSSVFGVRGYDEVWAGVKRAEKVYQAGDYDRAVYKCVASLQAKSDYEKAITLLKCVAPLAYKRHREAAAGYESKNRWDEVVAEYDAIIRLVDHVSSVRGEFPTVDVEYERDQAAHYAAYERDQAAHYAAEAHYQSGLSLMKAGRSKQAAVEFRKAQELIPHYKDAQTLYENTWLTSRPGLLSWRRHCKRRRPMEATWARCSGDERALPTAAKRPCKEMDTDVDPPEVLAHKALTELGQELASKLVAFFK